MQIQVQRQYKGKWEKPGFRPSPFFLSLLHIKSKFKNAVVASKFFCFPLKWVKTWLLYLQYQVFVTEQDFHVTMWEVSPPGMLAGDSGPVRGVLALAGEPAGEGEGPRMPGRWGDVWGEKGDWAWLLCSPWLLDTPDVLTPGLRAPSVPVGRSSMEPDRS